MAAFVRCGTARSALHLLWAAVPSSPGCSPVLVWRAGQADYSGFVREELVAVLKINGFEHFKGPWDRRVFVLRNKMKMGWKATEMEDFEQQEESQEYQEWRIFAACYPFPICQFPTRSCSMSDSACYRTTQTQVRNYDVSPKFHTLYI
jgi:hypothetical protein